MCPTTNECGVIGLRYDGEYCSIDKTWIDQKSGKEQCENNFECESNVCVSGQCISKGLIQKIIDFFIRLFGGKI